MFFLNKRTNFLRPMNPLPNMALNLAPFGRWTLASERRLPLRYASVLPPV